MTETGRQYKQVDNIAMSDHVGKVSNNRDNVSEEFSYSYQSSWVSRWIQTASKQGSMINPHSSVFSCEPDIQHSRHKRIPLGMSSHSPKLCSGGGNKLEAHSVGLLRERGQHFAVEKSDYETFRSFSLSTDKRKALATQTGHSNYEDETTTFLGGGKSRLGREDNLRSNFGCFSTSHLPLEGKGLAALKSSRETVSSLAASRVSPSSKFGVLERHLPGNASTDLDTQVNKIEKYSAILSCQEDPAHLATPIKQKNNHEFLQRDIQPINIFQPPCVRNQSQFVNMQEDSNHGMFRRTCPPRSYHGKPLEVSDVGTMRICTTIDSMENSQGGSPPFSHMTRHLLFTKQTGINLPRQEIFQEAKRSTQHKQGVTIQPLWSSTDDSEEKPGAGTTSEMGAGNEASTETKSAEIGVCGNENDVLGVASSELNTETPTRKGKLVIRNASSATAASRRDTIWGKSPIIKATNVNKEPICLPCQLRSIDGIDPTTSQTQSLGAEHHFSDTDDSPSRSKSYRPRNLIPLLEPSSPFVKRLKTSSSKSLDLVTEGSKLETSCSHEKTTKLNLLLGTNQNVESSLSSEKIHNSYASWIQRWRVNPSVVTPPHAKSQAVVICESNTSKLGFEELGRKHFPSIGAMALMGKSMNGLRPSELTKKGPLVVWNTKKTY